MWRYRKQGGGSEMVSASEIAAFVYCPEAWRLEHGLGLEAGNREAMEAGEVRQVKLVRSSGWKSRPGKV